MAVMTYVECWHLVCVILCDFSLSDAIFGFLHELSDRPFSVMPCRLLTRHCVEFEQ